MKNKVYILVISLLFVAAMALQATGTPAPHFEKEYQVKAAFLYNFIKFVEWPEEKMADSNEPIIIGIIGKSPFGNAFEPLKAKKVKARSVVVKRFKGFEKLKKSSEKDKSELGRKIEALRKCHLLFVCSSEKKNLKEIINSVKDHSVLTIDGMEGFLEAGGIIKFLVEEKKIRFEINVTASKRAKLKMRSQLLRLAKKVVKEKPSKETKS